MRPTVAGIVEPQESATRSFGPGLQVQGLCALHVRLEAAQKHQPRAATLGLVIGDVAGLRGGQKAGHAGHIGSQWGGI